MLYLDADQPPAGAVGGHHVDGRLFVVEERFIYMKASAPPIAIEDVAVEGILCEHMIEHIPPSDARMLCSEILRILRPGGILRLSTPDVELYCRRLYGVGPRARSFRHARRNRLREMLPLVPELAAMHSSTGARLSRAFVINQAFRCWGHKWLYDAEALDDLLSEVGFVQVRRRRYRRGARSLARWDNRYRRDESLYVEARRPT
jgi:predicted SAM-dependent methyltransferase